MYLRAIQLIRWQRFLIQHLLVCSLGFGRMDNQVFIQHKHPGISADRITHSRIIRYKHGQADLQLAAYAVQGNLLIGIADIFSQPF